MFIEILVSDPRIWLATQASICQTKLDATVHTGIAQQSQWCFQSTD